MREALAKERDIGTLSQVSLTPTLSRERERGNGALRDLHGVG
jgi:hypothetical protein